MPLHMCQISHGTMMTARGLKYQRQYDQFTIWRTSNIKCRSSIEKFYTSLSLTTDKQ